MDTQGRKIFKPGGNAMIRVGIAQKDYGSAWLFGDVNVNGCQYVPQRKLPLHVFGRLHPWARKTISATTYFPPPHSCDFFHTFNMIPLNRHPWIVSAESVFPRVWDCDPWRRFLLKRLASPHCLRILAMSENTLLHMRTRNSDDPNLDQVMKKAEVVDPGIPEGHFQEVLTSPSTKRSIDLVFVGNEFFRKGGTIAVSAFARLKKSHPVTLTVISKMQEGNYVFPVEPGSGIKWREKMAALGVNHQEGLPNSKVREILSRSDILLLPTFDDSYGGSVIEGMASGLAPIATKIRALPEIITQDVDGILLPCPVTHEGRMIFDPTVERQLEESLAQAIVSLMEHPEQLNQIKREARQTYLRRFHPNCLSKNLERIYKKAISP